MSANASGEAYKTRNSIQRHVSPSASRSSRPLEARMRLREFSTRLRLAAATVSSRNRRASAVIFTSVKIVRSQNLTLRSQVHNPRWNVRVGAHGSDLAAPESTRTRNRSNSEGRRSNRSSCRGRLQVARIWDSECVTSPRSRWTSGSRSYGWGRTKMMHRPHPLSQQEELDEDLDKRAEPEW